MVDNSLLDEIINESKEEEPEKLFPIYEAAPGFDSSRNLSCNPSC